MSLLHKITDGIDHLLEKLNLFGSYYDYECIRELGSGSFGEVLLHKNTESGELVAIKLIKKSETDKMVGYFLTEAYILKQLDHKNVIKFKAFTSYDDFHALVMEYIEGGISLHQYIMKKPMTEALAAPIFKQLVEAIAYIHQKGYAHMDIKPNNIYLCPNWQIKLLDFGLSLPINKALEEPIGPWFYRAPEVGSAKKKVCFPGPVDAFACGATLQVMLTGEQPKGPQGNLATNLNFQLMENISWELSTLLPRMLDPIPEERMTIKKILKHTWTQSSQEPDLNSSPFDGDFSGLIKDDNLVKSNFLFGQELWSHAIC